MRLPNTCMSLYNQENILYLKFKLSIRRFEEYCKPPLIFYKFLCFDSSFSAPSDGENQEDEPVDAVGKDSLSQEEYKRQIELEAEEKMLEETLEYQRRIENEAKLKHLAEQHKKDVTTLPEKMPAEVTPDACLSHEEDQDTNEQQKSTKKVIAFFHFLCCTLVLDMTFFNFYQSMWLWMIFLFS